VIRTVIATAAIGVSVSLVAAPAASAQIDCSVTRAGGGSVCTVQDVIHNYLAFPGEVIQAWTHPLSPIENPPTQVTTPPSFSPPSFSPRSSFSPSMGTAGSAGTTSAGTTPHHFGPPHQH
jgi:hypothetical protein